MSDRQMLLIGSGLVTALGVGVAQNAAHVRAGVSAFAESSFSDRRMKPIVAAALPMEAIAPWAGGDAVGMSPRACELVRLAGMAVAEALLGLPEVPVPTWCAWPDSETHVPLALDRLAVALAAQTGGRVVVRGAQRGRAGAVLAVADALAALATGQPYALVVGADSLLHQHVLGSLLHQQRLKTATHSDGLIPGMGAGALLLARSDALAGFKPLACIAGCGHGVEPGHLGNDGDWQGDVLAKAAQQALASGSTPVVEVWSAMTGERCWASELGVTQIRSGGRIPADANIRHPADAWGDLGAASGTALIVVAAAGALKGWARFPALILASGDLGARGALLLEVP